VCKVWRNKKLGVTCLFRCASLDSAVRIEIWVALLVSSCKLSYNLNAVGYREDGEVGEDGDITT
jgi:hypothetical protein